MMRALLASILLVGGCSASTTQQIRKGLGVSVEVAKLGLAVSGGDAFCRPIVDDCKAKADRAKCRETVLTCQSVQRDLLDAFKKFSAVLRDLNAAVRVAEALAKGGLP
jgi:hypothetical protein